MCALMAQVVAGDGVTNFAEFSGLHVRGGGLGAQMWGVWGV